MRGQLGVMQQQQSQPLPLPRNGTGQGGWGSVPLPPSTPSEEIWGNPKRLSSNGSSNGWEPEVQSDGGGAGGTTVGDELEMALRRSPFVKVCQRPFLCTHPSLSDRNLFHIYISRSLTVSRPPNQPSLT